MEERKLIERDLTKFKSNVEYNEFLKSVPDKEQLTNDELNRKELRMLYVNIFGEEKPGVGKEKGRKQEYKYIVDIFNDDNKEYRIFLNRPATTNWGVDFTICVEYKNKNDKDYQKYNFSKNSNRPSHKNIFEDLIEKKKESEQGYQKIIDLINRIYNLDFPREKEIESIESEFFLNKRGFSLILLLKMIKWLYIEQDVTYWLVSGKDKPHKYFTSNIIFLDLNEEKLYFEYNNVKSEIKNLKIEYFSYEFEKKIKVLLSNKKNIVFSLQEDKIFSKESDINENSYLIYDKESKFNNMIVLNKNKKRDKRLKEIDWNDRKLQSKKILNINSKYFANFIYQDNTNSFEFLISTDSYDIEKLLNTLIVIK